MSFIFTTLGLEGTLTEIGIGDRHFSEMAGKACAGGTLPGFVQLNQTDIENILTMCL